MSIQYFQRDTAATNTGTPPSPVLATRLASQTAGSSSADIPTGNIGGGLNTNVYFFTDADDPSTDGATGDYSIALRFSSTNAQIQVSVALARVNSAGAVQGSETALSTEQTSNTSPLVFNFTAEDLGTWASGDRLRVRVRLRNQHTMNQSATMAVNTSDDTIDTPFGGAPPVDGSLAVTQAGQTLSASGTSGVTVEGSLAVTQADQSLAGYGLVGGFPKVAGRASSFGGDVTSHSVSLPASIASGDLLIVHFVVDGSPTITWPGGWNSIADRGHNDGAASKSAVAYRIADGSEGSTITVTTSASEAAAHRSWRITNWRDTTPPEAASAVGSSATPDPPSLTPTWGAEDTLWLALSGHENWLTAVTNYPTNYHVPFTQSSFSGAGAAENVVQGTAERGLSAASEDPGAFTLSSSRVWAAFTVAVRPSGAVTVSGSLAATQADQVLAGAGHLTLTGSLAETQADQTSAASGVVGSVVAGSVDVTQADQSPSAAGVIGHTGTLAETQADQTLSASGAVGEVTTGTAASTQADDTLSATGQIGYLGSLAATQDGQTGSASGAVDVVPPLVDLHFIPLAPELAHGPVLAPELVVRAALAPELSHGQPGAPETAARAVGLPEVAHGKPGAPETAHGQPEHDLVHGDAGEPTV